jgi:hypothetical protein
LRAGKLEHALGLRARDPASKACGFMRDFIESSRAFRAAGGIARTSETRKRRTPNYIMSSNFLHGFTGINAASDPLKFVTFGAYPARILWRVNRTSFAAG